MDIGEEGARRTGATGVEGAQMLAESARKNESAPEPEELLRLFAMSNDLLAIVDTDGYFLRLNPTWEAVLGWSREELMSRPAYDFMHPDDVERTSALEDRGSNGGGDIVGFENRYRCRDGSYRWLLWSARSDGKRWYAVAKDVTERKDLEQRVQRDPLTGLPNRLILFDWLQEALERTEVGGAVILAFIDIDRFKAMNDGFGHEVGDQFLVATARRLRSVLREGDMVARLGGDEFVIAIEQAEQPARASEFGERLLRVFSHPFACEGEEFHISASIGVAVSTSASTPEDLLREADVAMYRAKTGGRRRWCLFDEKIRRQVAERQRVEFELRHILDRDELETHYQPIVSLGDGVPVGWEALARWRHPQRGIVPPLDFIPLAEENGQIIPIGARVLEQACRQARQWRSAGWNLTMSVNVSPRQLGQADFVRMIRRTTESTGLPAQVLCVELTESYLLDDVDRAVPVLEELRAMGVRIAIDDFGRGSSSLSYLKALPIDVIKIDRSFTAELENSREDRAVVKAVISLAEEVGISVIAEGVENPAQLGHLRELGCPLAQGFYFARPAPAAEVQLGGSSASLVRGVGDPFVIREFMRQIGIPARIDA